MAARSGELALYRSGGRELSPEQLAQCNLAAKPRETAEQLAERR